MYDNDRLQLLKEIMIKEFTAVELNLFLDTHPDSKEALADYNEVVCCLKELKMKYEKKYGPLMNFGESTSKCPWQWIEGPWPWEIDY